MPKNNYLNILKEVKKIVKKTCATEDRWRYHIYPVVEYGKLLAKKFNADEEIIELSCWLHDLTRIMGDVSNHHVTSSIKATGILRKLGYDEAKIKRVADCIYKHRGSSNFKKSSKEEEIVACADAMSHFEFRIILFYSAFGKKRMSLEDGTRWISNKIDRSWNKLTIPFAKGIMKDKYKSMKEILSFTEEIKFKKLIKNIGRK